MKLEINDFKTRDNLKKSFNMFFISKCFSKGILFKSRIKIHVPV